MKSFNPLDYPISLVYPNRVALSAWTEHIPFALTVIDMLRPRVLVELGAYYGVSYCAFCQAVAQLGLDTRAYAIDTWKGDPHAGFNGPEILNDLRAHHDALYSGFSRLIAATFDEALAHFSDGSIDLLHIDGYHTYDAVRHDFENWLPKLSPAGVVLFHDVNVRQGDFGVWRFWEEVRGKYPAFEFTHQHGLGVLAVGPEVPPRLRPLLEASGEEAARVREYFFQLGRRISQAWEGAQQVRGLVTEIGAQRDQFNRQAAEQQAVLADCRGRLAQTEQRLAEAEQRCYAQQQQLADAERALSAARAQARAEVDEKGRQLHERALRIGQQSMVLEAQKLQLTEQQIVLSAQAEQISSLSARARQLTAEINAVKASRTWRWGHALSSAYKKLAPAGTWPRRGFRPLARLFGKPAAPGNNESARLPAAPTNRAA